MASVVHGVLLLMIWVGWVRPIWAVISFEVTAILFCRWYAETNRKVIFGLSRLKALIYSDGPSIRMAFEQIQSIGRASVLSLAYSRIDLVVISLVISGDAMTQYLGIQRLGSAPLMLSSAFSSAVVSWLATLRNRPIQWKKNVIRVLGIAYSTGILVTIGIVIFGAVLSIWLGVKGVDHRLQWIQGITVGLQIANCFHAAILLASTNTCKLYRVARNAALLLAVLLPLGVWQGGIVGVALSVLLAELLVAGQYIHYFWKKMWSFS